MKTILIVGAGFAGAVHARLLANAGYKIDVIDQRSHIAGNCYDFIDENGIRKHKYGPHLFHTNNGKIVEWLSEFTTWVPYVHRVRALLKNDIDVPLPINRETINIVLGQSLSNDDEVRNFLSAISIPCGKPQNAADYLYSQVGEHLTDIFFRTYTKKMWALDLEELPVSVVQRIPMNVGSDDRYFPADQYNMLPKNGYTQLFRNILSHDSINVHLNVRFDKDLSKQYFHTFNSMAIDEYFDYAEGPLPYRSIKFHDFTDRVGRSDEGVSVINFTDDGPFTRKTYWHRLPKHWVSYTGRSSVTLEEPCDYKENDFERYYPVKTADDRFGLVYKKYKRLSESESNVSFIGRCGTYQYLNMDQVVNQSLISASKFIQQHRL